MKRLIASLAMGAALTALTPAVASAQETTGAVPPRLVGEAHTRAFVDIYAEARAFMEAYAEDLRRGDRSALASRYDRHGMWWVREGVVEPMGHEPLTAMYASDWNAPAAFEWRDLTYVPAGPDAVVVIGRFLWTDQSGAVHLVAYHNLLVRQDGVLRIRVEDETPVPAPPEE